MPSLSMRASIGASSAEPRPCVLHARDRSRGPAGRSAGSGAAPRRIARSATCKRAANAGVEAAVELDERGTRLGAQRRGRVRAPPSTRRTSGSRRVHAIRCGTEITRASTANTSSSTASRHDASGTAHDLQRIVEERTRQRAGDGATSSSVMRRISGCRRASAPVWRLWPIRRASCASIPSRANG